MNSQLSQWEAPAAAVPVAPQPPAVPPAVEDARRVLARFRKIMRRTGAVFGTTLAAATLATEPITWCLSASALGLTALAYRFPLSRRVRRARAALRGWEALQALGQPASAPAPSPSPVDPRVAAADAVIARLAEHGGADGRAAVFGRDVRQQLLRVLDDARAVEQLSQALPRAEADARLTALRSRVDERIARLLGAVTEVYEALLARDDTALASVLARGEDALRQLRAREEVERLLER